MKIDLKISGFRGDHSADFVFVCLSVSMLSLLYTYMQIYNSITRVTNLGICVHFGSKPIRLRKSRNL
jgi:hypothetical protein